MPEGFGDVLHVPSQTQVAEVAPGDILYATGSGMLRKGVTLASSGGVMPAGTVLGRITASKKYEHYIDGKSNGAEVARGVLAESVDLSKGDKLANIYYGGDLKLSKLIGLDSNGIADLNGKSDSDRDFFRF